MRAVVQRHHNCNIDTVRTERLLHACSHWYVMLRFFGMCMLDNPAAGIVLVLTVGWL
jgi:hypothetical protein